MRSAKLIHALTWASTFALAVSSASTSDHSVRVRNAPGTTSEDTLRAVRRSLHDARSARRDTVLKNSTNLEKSWNGAVLFSLAGEVANTGNVSVTAGAEITCTTCYVKGIATTELSINGDFNITQEFGNFTDDVREGITNVTTTAIDYVEDYFSGVFDNFDDGIDLDDFDFPPLDVEFNVDVPDIPESRLQIMFDELELYMMIDTVLSAGASYTLNLYSSNSPIGLSVSSDLFIGVIFSIDLLLSVDAEIDISSGIHIKIEDGLALNIPMFGHSVSDITFNGGDVEFLPVTVESAGGVLKAVLRVGIHAGFELESPTVFIPTAGFSTNARAGVEVGVYADLAEFATNITVSPDGDDTDCSLRAVQAYQLALGAAAGATLAIGLQTWGPQPGTQIPIWYTTMADICAISATKTSSATTPAITGRDDEDLTTSTLSEKVIYTGVACISSGLANCPVSLQTTTKVTSTRTLVTAVPSDSEAAFPASTQSSVASTVPFGTNRKSIVATTGSPVSFVPPPPTASGDAGASEDAGASGDEPLGEVGGIDTRIILGVSIGIGVPVLAAIIVGIYFCVKRRRYAPISKADTAYFGTPEHYVGATRTRDPKTGAIMVTSTRGGY